MSIQGELEVGDIVGHPSWGGTTHEVTMITSNRFFLRMGAHSTNEIIGFPFYNEFFIAHKKKPRQKIKSGFGKWISKHEHA